MIIVSQNKRNIYNFDNVKSIDIVNNEIYISDDILSDMGTCIANYETEERAKEVLQEIYKVKSDFELIKNTRDNIQRDLIVGNKQDFFDVYEMPKE